MNNYTFLKVDSACCCIYNDSIFYYEGEISIKKVKKDFESLYDIKIDCLPSNMINDTLNEFKKYLKKIGFKELKTKTVLISD